MWHRTSGMLAVEILAAAFLAACSGAPPVASIGPSPAAPSPAASAPAGSAPGGSAPAASAPAAATDSEAYLVNTDLATTRVAAEGSRTVTVMAADVVVRDPGERRLVASFLVIAAASDRLYVGQRPVCTGPSGRTVSGVVVGRNVSAHAQHERITAPLFLLATESGVWHCEVQINVCQPGLCTTTGGEGEVILGSRDAPATDGAFSELRISAPDESSDRPARLGVADVLVPAGESVDMSATLALSDSTPLDATTLGGAPEAFGVLGIVDVTNCVGRDFPHVCREAEVADPTGSSWVRVTATGRQPSSMGAPCAQAQAIVELQHHTRDEITWSEHHSAVVFVIPYVEPSGAPGCLPEFRVTVTTVKGNDVAVERGTARVPRAIVGLLPY